MSPSPRILRGFSGDCQRTGRELSEDCHGVVMGLSRDCHEIVMGLSQDFHGIVRELSGNYHGIVRGFSRDCKGIVSKDPCLVLTDPKEFSKQHLIKSEEPLSFWKIYSVYFGEISTL